MEEQRFLMVQDHQTGMSISELADVYGIARKTVYKWLERYDEYGPKGLTELSRRPHHSPNQVSTEVESAIVAARYRWRWGPGKLRVKLFGASACQPISSQLLTVAALIWGD